MLPIEESGNDLENVVVHTAGIVIYWCCLKKSFAITIFLLRVDEISQRDSYCVFRKRALKIVPLLTNKDAKQLE